MTSTSSTPIVAYVTRVPSVESVDPETAIVCSPTQIAPRPHPSIVFFADAGGARREVLKARYHERVQIYLEESLRGHDHGTRPPRIDRDTW